MSEPPPSINLRNSLAINFFVLRISGLWAPEEQVKTWRTTLYRLYSFAIVGFLNFIYISLEIINMVIVWGDMEKMIKGSFLLLTQLAQVAKTYNFIFKHKEVLDILNRLDYPIFRPTSATRHIVEKSRWTCRRDTIPFLTMAVTTCCMWAIVPIISNDAELEHRQLPLEGWFPFDTDRSPMYELCYAYQILGVTVVAACNICMDTIASGLMALSGGQLDVLRYNLSKMGSDEDEIQDAVKSLDKKTVLDIPKINPATTNTLENIALKNTRKKEATKNKGSALGIDDSEKWNNDIKKCVLHHEAIFHFVILQENLFNFSVLAQFTSAAVILCITAFQISLVSSLSLQFFSMLLYQSCILYEIWLYCVHGNEIIIKSSMLPTSAYCCEWYKSPPSFRRSLLIVTEKTKVPMKVTAGKLFTLSIDTFTAILRSAYSYYAVLQRMHSTETN